MEVPAVTMEQMREVDRLMVEKLGISLLQMMENAGRILAELTVELCDPGRVTVLVGKGNNGGGGLVAARYLHNKGVEVEVVLSTGDLGDVPAGHLDTLRELGVPVRGSPRRETEVLVDALLGYNQRGEPRGGVADVMEAALDLELPVISLDVPSGFDLATGEYQEIAFVDPVTLTLGLPKVHMRGNISRIWLADIGIPREVYRHLDVEVPVLFKETDHFRIFKPMLW